MFTDWSLLSEDLQLLVSQTAMRHAAVAIAGQADTLAAEMDSGTVSDLGGPEALRLLAAMVRAGADASLDVAGHA